MIGIHTGANIAFVADHQPWPNLAAKKLPRQPMRWIHLSFKAHHSVTAGNHHPTPQPAPSVRLGTHLGQKSFSWSKFHWNSPENRLYYLNSRSVAAKPFQHRRRPQPLNAGRMLSV